MWWETVSIDRKISEKKIFCKKKSDDLLEIAIGNFGKWQLKIYILVLLIFLPSSWVELGIELLGHKIPFRCKHTETENQEGWISENNSMYFSKDICTNVSSSSTPCPWGYQYDTSVIGKNIVTEWDLVCSRDNLINYLQMGVMFGGLVGSAVFGLFADIYGRRLCLIICCAFRTLCGVLSVLSTNFPVYLINRIFLSIFDGGVSSTALILCLEILGDPWRTILSILFQVPYGMGFPIMATVTIYFKNWRESQLALFGLSVLTVVFSCMTPESPRWLLAADRKKEAIHILEKAVKLNGRNRLNVNELLKKPQSTYDDPADVISFLTLFKTPEMRQRTILACLNGIFWLLSIFGESSNNPILELTVQGISIVIGSIIAAMIVHKYSQRNTIAIMSLIMGFSLLLTLLVPGNYVSVHMFLNGIVYMALGIATSIMEPFVCQLFPTVLRNSGFGLFSVSMSIGSIIAPLIINFDKIASNLPILIFGFLSILEAFLVLLLPQPEESDLPERIKDIEEKKV